MNVGSLFAGIGGFDLGLERAGMHTVWQVEQEEFRRQVLARHFPDAQRFEDVREVGAHNLAPVDVICGGFPCQAHSVAGKQRHQEDERWLWPEFARIVRELRPRCVLVENVPGLLARAGGMGDVLGDLARCGYVCEWDCLPAATFGAPHLRYRVWLVAHAHEGELRLQPAGQSWCDCPSVFRDDGTQGLMGNADIAPADPHAAAGASRGPVSESGWWSAEPGVGRVADGVPNRVDRLAALGDALVPQIAEWIGRRILEHGGLGVAA